MFLAENLSSKVVHFPIFAVNVWNVAHRARTSGGLNFLDFRPSVHDWLVGDFCASTTSPCAASICGSPGRTSLARLRRRASGSGRQTRGASGGDAGRRGDDSPTQRLAIVDCKACGGVSDQT